MRTGRPILAKLASPLLTALLVLAACAPTAHWRAAEATGRDQFPGDYWAKAESPESVGWSAELLQKVRTYSEEIGSTAVMIVQGGIVIDAWGQITVKSNLHSGRKSLLSALIGIEVGRGKIDLSDTMGELGIDDNPPSLTELEKTATVGDLIRARSGVYHPALYETRQMTASKPPRGSHAPGELWHYNNWDFNALGTIYERESGQKIFAAFKREIADPIGMEDYAVSDGEYVHGAKSIHPAYPFRMTARDFARFALLYLRQGRWRDQQLIPSEWVIESTLPHSQYGLHSGYGYMWWTGEEDGLFPHVSIREPGYYASGWGRQLAIVLPYLDLVVVHRVNTDLPNPFPSRSEIGKLLWLILAAAGESDHGPEPQFVRGPQAK